MWGKGSVQIQFFVHKEVHQEIPGDRNDEIDDCQKSQQAVGAFCQLYHADAGKGKIDDVQDVIEGDGGENLSFLATREPMVTASIMRISSLEKATIAFTRRSRRPEAHPPG